MIGGNSIDSDRERMWLIARGIIEGEDEAECYISENVRRGSVSLGHWVFLEDIDVRHTS